MTAHQGHHRRGSVRRCGALAAALSVGLLAPAVLESGVAHAAPPTGTVYVNRDLPKNRLVPGARSGDVFTYRTTGSDGKSQISSAMVQVPAGRAPAGGWPVVVWSHDTRGVADRCAPSNRPLPADTEEIRKWISRRYAVLSPDLAGLGTPGTPLSFDTGSAARGIVDAVKAGHDVTAGLGRRWAVVGHAYGSPAAIELAHSATRMQGPRLDYRGTATESIPAESAGIYANLGPSTEVLPRAATLEVLYTLTAVRIARPAVGLGPYLTDDGVRWLNRAATACADELAPQVTNLKLGTLFTKPLGGNRAAMEVLSSAFDMPIRGFTRPVLLGQSLVDDSVSVPLALRYLNDAHRADYHAIGHTYLTVDPKQADALADNDVRQFIARLLGR